MLRSTILTLVLLGVFGCANHDIEERISTEMVYINNGAKQCGYKGTPPIKTARLLSAAGIDVIKSECGFLTGRAVISMCGADDLKINLHTIESDDIAKAEDLGFTAVSSLKDNNDMGFQVIGCPASSI